MQNKKVPAEEIRSASPEELIRAFSPWLHHMTSKFSGYLGRSGALDAEDIYWAGAEALIKAQSSWDSAVGEFLTHAYYIVLSAMQRALSFGKNKIDPPMVYLDAPLAHDDESTLLDTLASDDEGPDEAAEREDLKGQVQAALDRLGDPVAENILKQKYYDEKTAKEIASDLGMELSEVRNYTSRALRRLRQDRRLASAAPFVRRVGLTEFLRTRTSEVEWAVLERERVYNRLYGGINKSMGW